MTNRFDPPVRARDAAHGIVYRNDQEFCGWPFISGFWTNADGHHLVAFKKKPSAYQSAEDVHHDEVAKVGPQMVTLRSRDNGRTWDRASLQLLYDLAAPQEEIFAGRPQDYSAEPRPDFLDRNVLVASGATPDYFRPHSRAWIRLSTDGRIELAQADPRAQRRPAVIVRACLVTGAPGRRQPDLHDRGQPGRLEAPAGRLCAASTAARTGLSCR